MKKPCGVCDECVFRATGVYPEPKPAWGFLLRTDCRMRHNGIDFIVTSDFASFKGIDRDDSDIIVGSINNLAT